MEIGFLDDAPRFQSKRILRRRDQGVCWHSFLIIAPFKRGLYRTKFCGSLNIVIKRNNGHSIARFVHFIKDDSIIDLVAELKKFYSSRFLFLFCSSKKNLWRRKCVKRAIFRNVEIRVEEGASPTSTLTLFATRPTVSLCDLSGVILHQKRMYPFLSEI